MEGGTGLFVQISFVREVERGTKTMENGGKQRE